MADDESGNFVGSIHDEAYARPFMAPLAQAGELFEAEGREPAMDLCGDWAFHPDPYDTCLRQRWPEAPARDAAGLPLPADYDYASWPRIRVPSCWNTEAREWLLYEGPAVYRREFEPPAAPEGHEAFLRFEAVAYEAKVFLNGRFLGRHLGASTPFCLPAAGLRAGANELVIVVDDERRADRVPARNTDWYNYGGIHRPVALYFLPRERIRRWFARLVPGGMAVDVEVSGAGEGRAAFAMPGLDLVAEIEVRDGRGRAVFPADPEPWAPGSPRLYDVVITYEASGGGRDMLRDRMGFRTIEAKDGRLLLNGKPLFLRGVSCHEDSVERGRSLEEADIRRNFALALELGCNFVRLAHYPHSALAARIADEMGLLLWEEVAVYWAIDFNNPATLADARNQLAELVLRDRNRAGVICWSVGNENADTDARLAFMTALAALARELDGSRLVAAACLVDHGSLEIRDRLAEALDLIGINEYYGWYDRDLSKLPLVFERSRKDKPIVVSEFGADALAGRRGGPEELGTEDCQREVYRRQIEALRAVPTLAGMSPWILHDFRSPRRMGGWQRGFNTKGLVAADKATKKLAFGALRDFYAERAGEG